MPRNTVKHQKDSCSVQEFPYSDGRITNAVDIQSNVLLRGIFVFGFTSFNSHDVFIRLSFFVCLLLILDFERGRITQT